MQNFEEHIEQIESYLEGKLSEEERRDFEKRLAADASLKKEVDVYRKLIKGIESAGTSNFLSKMNDWEQEISGMEIGKPQQKNPWKLYAIAALIIMFVMPFGYLIIQNANSSSDEIFAEYFEPYEDLISERDAGVEPELVRGMEHYNSKEFGQAIKQFTSYLNNSPDDLEVQLYLAIAFLANDEPHFAEKGFTNLMAFPDNLFYPQVQWYYTMCKLKLGKNGELKKLVNEISSDPDHDYYQLALKLKSDL